MSDPKRPKGIIQVTLEYNGRGTPPDYEEEEETMTDYPIPERYKKHYDFMKQFDVHDEAGESCDLEIRLIEEVARLEATIKRLKNSIDYRMNGHLVEMKPEWDDSITGFDEAWAIVNEVFSDGTWEPQAQRKPGE